MASKRKPTKNRDPNQITADCSPGEDYATVFTRTMSHPTVQAAATLKEYGKSYGDDLNMDDLINLMKEQTQASRSGDLRQSDTMLTVQAHALDAIFNNLARRAVNAEYVDNFERYLKLALRAQSQSRATWETLSTIKNPPAVGYVRQANIAHGPQQVNNAPAARTKAAPGDAPCAGENPNLQNKLLEEKDGERLDPGTACPPSRVDPAMATVGEGNGAEDRGW